jgi:transcriptional regulator with XRE-family HTH domain
MLDKLDKRIGARIRLEREGRGWSLTELAERSGVSRAMVHKVEKGDSSPTAMLLGRLSGAFGMSMSTLMAKAEMREGRLLIRQNQPSWVDPQTGYTRRHVSPTSDLPIDVVQIELPPQKHVTFPAAAYKSRRHLIWVLLGSLVFQEGQTRHEMDEGDCLELGPPAECAFRNESDKPCIYAVIVLKDV